MKISSIFTASALLGTFASAAPPSALNSRVFQVSVTFYGAEEDVFYGVTFPADGTQVKISTFVKSSHLKKKNKIK